MIEIKFDLTNKKDASSVMNLISATHGLQMAPVPEQVIVPLVPTPAAPAKPAPATPPPAAPLPDPVPVAPAPAVPAPAAPDAPAVVVPDGYDISDKGLQTAIQTVVAGGVSKGVGVPQVLAELKALGVDRASQLDPEKRVTFLSNIFALIQ